MKIEKFWVLEGFDHWQKLLHELELSFKICQPIDLIRIHGPKNAICLERPKLACALAKTLLPPPPIVMIHRPELNDLVELVVEDYLYQCSLIKLLTPGEQII